MVVEILKLKVDISYFPVEVQSAIAKYYESDLAVFEEFVSAREVLMDTITCY